MGNEGLKEKIAQLSEASDYEAEEDVVKFKEEQKKKVEREIEIIKNSPLPRSPPPAPFLMKTPPPPPPLPITPIPETPDYLELDGFEEDPFGPQCMVCMTRVQRGMLELECGHTFHRRCLMPWVENVPKKGDRFLTQRARCPCCRGWALAKDNEVITSLVKPIVDQFRKMCDMLLLNPDIDEKDRESIKDMKDAKKELPFMKEYVFYLCFECGELYFGGLQDCQINHGEEDEEESKKDHICVKCFNKKCKTNYPTSCEKHGDSFIVFKCRYCCKLANWHCSIGPGGMHFCEKCHSLYPNMVTIPCPGPPACPGTHVKNGMTPESEQCLGCVLCRKHY